MKQIITQHGKLSKVKYGVFGAERKKAAIALCLIAVMGILWIRVLTRQAPPAAEAALGTEQINGNGLSDQELTISYIELPQIAGRNDVITRDFFASNGWRNFDNDNGRNVTVIKEVNIIPKNGNEEVIKKVAEKLKLEAIGVLSNSPWVFINNKVMSIGDTMLISDGIDTYECEVIEIDKEKNKVVIKCKDAEVILKLTQLPMNEK